LLEFPYPLEIHRYDFVLCFDFPAAALSAPIFLYLFAISSGGSSGEKRG
jgi:hypothetical protein